MDHQSQQSRSIYGPKDRQCCTPKKCLLFCCILILLLAGVGILLYFIIRVPDISNVQLLERRADDGSGPVILNASATPVTVTILLLLNATVTSSSIAQYKIDKVSVDMFIKTTTNGQQPVGGGSNQLTVPPQGSAQLSIPLSVNITGTTDNPAIKQLFASCAQPGGRIPLHYKVSITAFGILNNLQVYESDYNQNCPSLGQIGSVLSGSLF